MRTIGLLTVALAMTAPARGPSAPALIGVARIWDAGAHNAFTDLVRWRGRWYCTFREGDDHVGGDGRIRVLVSEDGDALAELLRVARGEDVHLPGAGEGRVTA